MSVLYIAGQRPGAGSTAVAASLAMALRKHGRKVALVKPVSLESEDRDAAWLASLTGQRETAPLAVGATVTGDVLDSAARRVQTLAKDADVVVVEGLPLEAADGSAIAASPALAKKMTAKVIGVLPYRRDLGRDDASEWREAYGDALSGAVVNRRTRYAGHDASARLTPELADAGMPALAVLGEERLLLAPTVREVADRLQGKFFTGESGGEALIEHFLIGALITEWGGNYFGRYPNQVVLARCGRTDLQMAALNFPLNALFLTGGCEEPPQYVYQRADYMDVPLILSPLTTQAAVEEIGRLRVTVHHPAKIARLTEVMDRSMDWEVLSAAVLN